MATEFRTTSTDELALVRFFGGTTRGMCFELGTVTNFENVTRALRTGEQLMSNQGERLNLTAESLEQLCADDRVTFGEMDVTVELGSGDMLRMTEEL